MPKKSNNSNNNNNRDTELDSFRYHYSVTVTRVIDADTLDVDIDLGFGLKFSNKLRLYGINAYEKNDPDPEKRKLAKDGIAYVGRLLAPNMAPRCETIIHTHKDAIEKYGRYLAVVYYYLQDDGVWHNLNQELVDSGLAVTYLPKSVMML